MRGKIKIKRNIGGELLANIIIRTGRSGRADLNRFRRILEEQNNESQQRYNSRPSPMYPRPGNAVSGGEATMKAAITSHRQMQLQRQCAVVYSMDTRHS